MSVRMAGAMECEGQKGRDSRWGKLKFLCCCKCRWIVRHQNFNHMTAGVLQQP